MLTYFLAQICQIKMAVDHLEKDTVTLVPDILQMQEERDGIPIYTIVVWRFKYLNTSNPNSGIVVEIILKRKLMSELMTTYFPTILLVAITFATSQSWGKVYIETKFNCLFTKQTNRSSLMQHSFSVMKL